MTSKHARLATLVVTLTLAACTTSNGAPSGEATQPPAVTQPSAPAVLQPTAVVASPTPTPAATESPAASSSAVAEGEPTPGPTAGPTDPCSLLTQAQASQLIGVALGPGKRQVADPDTICTWSKGTTEVKVFLTAPTTPEAAKAYYEAHKSEIPAGAHITELPTFFDGAVIAKGTTQVGTIGGIFVLDGTHFFELYCGSPACSDNALKGGAQLIDGRLP